MTNDDSMKKYKEKNERKCKNPRDINGYVSWWYGFSLLSPVTSLGCAADRRIVPRPVLQLRQQGSSPDGRQISGGTGGAGDLRATALQRAQLI